MEDGVCLEGYTASLCCCSCKKERMETKMVRNVLLNKIEITFGIHEGQYFLPYKNHHELLSASKIFALRLTMTRTKLIHCSNLCPRCIGPGFFALLSIVWFLATLRLFVAFSLIIGEKDLFSTAVFMRIAGNKSITLLRLSRSGKYRTSTRWQGWFELTIQVGSEFFCEGNQIMLSFWHDWLCADFLLHWRVQPCKKEHTYILAGLLASSTVSILRVLNCRKNVSSDSLDAFLACTQSSHEV